MQIPKNSRIPKIISGIAGIISVIAIGWFLLSQFWFWVSLEIIAAVFVAVGCTGEWWLHHHPAGRKKKEKDEQHKIESRFIAMVSLGVIMELFALGDSIREGIKLEDAVSKANERTALIESNNLVLRSNVVVLELKSKPRTISAKQMIDFIFLTEKITKKIPIVVHASSSGDDTYSFSAQIRTMLDSAGFLRDNSPNGIGIDAQSHVYVTPARVAGAIGEMPSVFFYNFSTNKLPAIDTYLVEPANGFRRPIIMEQNEMKVYEAIRDCFNEIGIKAEWQDQANRSEAMGVSFQILIPPKSY